MNWRVIFRVQGILLAVLTGAMIPSVGFSIYYGGDDLMALVQGIVITAFCGLILLWVFKNAPSHIRAREGYVSVTLGWIFAAVFAAIPFHLHGSFGSFINCFFEAMSGFTTTGASILTDIEIVPHGLLFWRSMTHWLGGMGIILLTIAILPLLGVSGNQLFRAEVPGPIKSRFLPKLSDTAKYLWLIYFGLSFLQTALLMLGGLNLFDALCHTFGTMATGGFSTLNASVAGFNSLYIEAVIILFMYLAGVNFVLYFYILKGNFRGFIKNRELRFYTSVLAVGVLAVSASLFFSGGADVAGSLRRGAFQVVSITTTTGFVTADFNLWPLFAQLVLVGLMFFGASGGSTGGGMKQIRVMILMKSVWIEVMKLLHPNAVFATRIEKQPVSGQAVQNTMAFFALYVSMFVFTTVFLAAMGYDLTTSFSASVATLSNIGPGLGAVGAVENYAFFDPVSKLVLSLSMLAGRLEVFSVIIFFYCLFNPRRS